MALAEADKKAGIVAYEHGKLRVIVFAKIGTYRNEVFTGQLGPVQVYSGDRLRLVIDDATTAKELLEHKKQKRPGETDWPHQVIELKLGALMRTAEGILEVSKNMKEESRRLGPGERHTAPPANNYKDRFFNLVTAGHKRMITLDNQLPYTGIPIVTMAEGTLSLGLPVILEGVTDENFAEKMGQMGEHAYRTASILLGILNDNAAQAALETSELMSATTGQPDALVRV